MATSSSVKRIPETTITSDVRMILDRDPFDAAAVADLREALNRDPSRYRTLRDAAATMLERERATMTPAVHLRLGVAFVLMGRYRDGIDHLNELSDTGLAQFFRGQALEALQLFREAAAAYGQAAELGHAKDLALLHRIGCFRKHGDRDKARELLAGYDRKAGHGAEFHFQTGAMLADEGELVLAAAELEKSLEIDREHSQSLFQLAYINDLKGNDDVAKDLYNRCTQRPPVPLAALVNLGILYEDEMRFRDAEACFKRVLDFDPNHPRARLYFKDCRASKDMYYDEEAERGYDRLRQILEVPVTDFELSVRSRNCLRKMNIRTLGDLTRTTELQLLSSKNFGETSLSEIKEMLQSKGLRLGLALEGGDRQHNDYRHDPQTELSQEEKALLSKPISDLNLSVRARKCMSKLGIQSLGDLVQHTSNQLLDCKNFGVTSLNEVREKLTLINLKLKDE